MDHSSPMCLARHGETAWSLSGRHTGRTDLPLTERGEDNARKLRGRLEGITFTVFLVSPLQRARRTCRPRGLRGCRDRDSRPYGMGLRRL